EAGGIGGGVARRGAPGRGTGGRGAGVAGRGPPPIGGSDTGGGGIRSLVACAGGTPRSKALGAGGAAGRAGVPPPVNLNSDGRGGAKAPRSPPAPVGGSGLCPDASASSEEHASELQ